MGKKDSRRKKPKKKQDEVRYVDDGSTVVDMSGLDADRPRLRPRVTPGRPEPRTRAGKIWQTYKDAVRSMIAPMLIFIGGMSVVFLLVYIILGFFV